MPLQPNPRRRHHAELSSSPHDSHQRLRAVPRGVVLGDRFELGDKVAEGGMGCIYRAYDRCEGRDVAVKLLRPEVAELPDLRQRFLNEAQAVMSIVHDNVVEVLAIGELPDGSAFYAMELLEGRSLDEQGTLEIDTVVELGLQLCAGLGAAHDRGVVHRDLKPENVMVAPRPDGSLGCKLIDFGVAKLSHCGALTLPGQIMGTPAYLPPEQARGEIGYDPRSDVYSLGVVLYELIARRLPFERGDMLQQLLAHQLDAPPPLSAPGCPPRLAAAVMRCLEKRPEERFASMDALAEELAAVQAALSIEDEPTLVVPPPPIASWPAPRGDAAPAWLAPSLVLLALLVTMGVTLSLLAS